MISPQKLLAKEQQQMDKVTQKGFVFEITEEAEDGECGKVCLTKCEKERKVLSIPAQIRIGKKKYVVTSIGERAFAKQTTMEKVYFPKTLERIGQQAFWNCTSLQWVYFPASLETLEGEAFSGCRSLEKVYVKESEHFVVKDNALYSVDEKKLYLVLKTGFSYEIGPKVRSVEAGAFVYCPRLEKIVVGSKVLSFGVQGANGTCPRLKEIVFLGTLPKIAEAQKKGIVLHRRIDLTRRTDFWVTLYQKQEVEQLKPLRNLMEGAPLKEHVRYVNLKQKRAFLTFDDGPSACTDQVLDILDRYHVKATWFVVRSEDPANILRYQKIIERGHTLGMHSQTHNYGQVYSFLSSFQNDIEGLSEYLYRITGVRPAYYRFPGGSSNGYIGGLLPAAKTYLYQQHLNYFDWNASSQDAVNPPPASSTIISSVLGGIHGQENVVILFHDSSPHASSVASLPTIIESLKRQGYSIEAIDATTVPVQHR